MWLDRTVWGYRRLIFQIAIALMVSIPFGQCTFGQPYQGRRCQTNCDAAYDYVPESQCNSCDTQQEYFCENQCDQRYAYGPGCLIGSISYLHWQVDHSGTDFATQIDPVTFVPGAVERLDFDSSGGLRAMIGSQLGESSFLTLTFTNFETEAAGQTSGFLGGQRAHPAFNVNADEASASASLEYRTYDLDLQRRIFESESSQFTVFGGLRFGTIDQSLNINYDGIDFDNTLIDNQLDTEAFGFRAGVAWETRLSYQTFLRISSAASVLRGSFEHSWDEVDDTDGVIANSVDSFERGLGTLESSISLVMKGPIWEISGGYEFTNWINMPQRFSFTDSNNRSAFEYGSSDLLLHGWALSAALVY